MNNKQYFVLVKFRDATRKEHVVPSSHVKDFTPPGFDTSRPYYVFWSGEKESTLESMSKSRTQIPCYPENTASTSPGYYKADILFLAGNGLFQNRAWFCQISLSLRSLKAHILKQYLWF